MLDCQLVFVVMDGHGLVSPDVEHGVHDALNSIYGLAHDEHFFHFSVDLDDLVVYGVLVLGLHAFGPVCEILFPV